MESLRGKILTETLALISRELEFPFVRLMSGFSAIKRKPSDSYHHVVLSTTVSAEVAINMKLPCQRKRAIIIIN